MAAARHLMGAGTHSEVHAMPAPAGTWRAREYFTAINDHLGVPRDVMADITALQALRAVPGVVPLLSVEASGTAEVEAWLRATAPYPADGASCVRRHMDMPLRHKNSMFEHVLARRDRRVPYADIQRWMRQLRVATAETHARDTLHRDIKPQNVLVVAAASTGAGTSVELCDFGLASFAFAPWLSLPEHPAAPAANTNRDVQTLWYRAPEVMLGAGYTAKADVWSLGVVLADWLSARP